MHRKGYRWMWLAGIIVITSLFVSGCSALGLEATSKPTLKPTFTHTPQPTFTPTLPPTETPLPPTATRIEPTDTPEPTETPAPTTNPTLEARVNATNDAAPAMKVIDPFLRRYGVSTTGGRVGFFYTDPMDFSTKDYMGFIPYMLVEQPVKDFVFQTDITWNSTSGLAGCGMLLRASKDYLNGGGFYRLGLIRIRMAPEWDLDYWEFNDLKQGVSVNNLTYSIKDQNNQTNRVTVIAQGQEWTIYINDEKQGVYYSGARLDGMLGLQTYQESGSTTCSYKNTWIWIIK